MKRSVHFPHPNFTFGTPSKVKKSKKTKTSDTAAKFSPLKFTFGASPSGEQVIDTTILHLSSHATSQCDKSKDFVKYGEVNDRNTGTKNEAVNESDTPSQAPMQEHDFIKKTNKLSIAPTELHLEKNIIEESPKVSNDAATPAAKNDLDQFQRLWDKFGHQLE